MAWTDDLKTARDNMAARLKDITASPKPSYSVDGQSVSWIQYHQMLMEALKTTTDLINQESGEMGPYEEFIQGFVEPAYGATRASGY